MKSKLQNKREFLKMMGASTLSIPLLGLIGCGGEGSSNSTAPSTSTIPSTATPMPAFVTKPWLSGSTAKITDNYPQDSLFSSSTPCKITMVPSTTEGPCYYAVENTEDISVDLSGVPMMVCLQITDNQCRALAGYEVEVWHADTRGVYSADTTGSRDAARFDTQFCTNGDAKAKTSKWFRGTLVSDANGRVNFKSCFPGWYPGRTIHVHFRIRNNNLDSLVSQLSFTDEVCNDICTKVVPYKARGKQDTSLTVDGVFTSSNTSALQFEMKQNTDGSLLAYKTIQIN